MFSSRKFHSRSGSFVGKIIKIYHCGSLSGGSKILVLVHHFLSPLKTLENHLSYNKTFIAIIAIH